MSIDLSIGPLVNVTAAEWGESLGFYEHVESLFTAISAALHGRGLPRYDEPRTLDFSPPAWTLTSGLYPFRDYAEARERDTALRFPHVLACAHENFGLFVPVLFDEVIELRSDDGRLQGSCGSAYRLFDECSAIADLLGVLGDIEVDPPTSVDHAIHAALGERRLRVTDEQRGEGREVAVSGWPSGADGCAKLYAAARLAIEHRISIVIH